MSRFFHGGDSDSESSSSDEEELYSDRERADASEEESDEDHTESEEESSSSDDEGKETGANRFLKPSGGGAEDSEESEDEDRVTVVKSAKDKRLEELEGTIRLIDNAEKINDWPDRPTHDDRSGTSAPFLSSPGPSDSATTTVWRGSKPGVRMVHNSSSSERANETRVGE